MDRVEVEPEDFQALKKRVIAMDQKIDVLGLGVLKTLQGLVTLMKKEPLRNDMSDRDVPRSPAFRDSLLRVNEGEPGFTMMMSDRVLACSFQLVFKQYPTEADLFESFKRFRGKVPKRELKLWWELHREKLWKFDLLLLFFET